MGKNRDHSKFPNAITVLDNGNVGIGTTDATHKLVLQNGTSEVGIRMTDGTNNTYFAHVAANNNFANGTIAGDVVVRGTNGVCLAPNNGSAVAMRIASNGTTIFSSSITAGARVQAQGSNGAGTSQGGFLINYNANANSRSWLINNDYNVFGDFAILQTTTQTGSTFNDAYLYINPSGRVGIGTLAPNHKLSIVDSGFNQYSLRLESQSGNTTNRWGGIGFAGEGSNTKAGIFFVSEGGSYSRGNLVFANNSDFNQNSATPSDARMSITKEGYITKPNQPSFMAAGNSGSISVSGGNVLVFNANRYNTGGHFNTGNGRFTAPVAGKYLFSWNIYHFGGYVTGMVLTINGSQYAPADVVPYTYRSSSDPEGTTGCTVQLDLSANDYVEVRVRAGFGAAQIYMSHSYFSGHLLS